MADSTQIPAVLDPRNVVPTLPPTAVEEQACEIFARIYYTPTTVMNAIALEALLKECTK
jgi:hypothetical protein